jgi:glycosyltransferase involved in cell wall biosynthesis
MKILHVIASVDPEGGGPIEYARVLAERHEAIGHTCGFVTLDPKTAGFLTDFPFEVHCTGAGRGFFADGRTFGAKVAAVSKNYDVAIVHGLWNVATIAGHRALNAAEVPWVIFTHGMLDPYFRRIKPVKHWIKQIFWTLWQGRVLSGAQAVLFTCEDEQRLAQKAFLGHQNYTGKVVAFCASDQRIPEVDLDLGRQAFRRAVPRLEKRDYFLFLSRIHPKKACDNLIEAFARVALMAPELDLVFAGPDQNGWQAELVTLAERLGISHRVHWAGMLQGSTKSAAFADAKAFTLPSHQENFGLVVAEALSLGTPVLISNKVNIWREIIDDGAGLAGLDTVEATVEVLSTFLSQRSEEAVIMKAAARPCYEQRFSVGAASDGLLHALEEALNRQGAEL